VVKLFLVADNFGFAFLIDVLLILLAFFSVVHDVLGLVWGLLCNGVQLFYGLSLLSNE